MITQAWRRLRADYMPEAAGQGRVMAPLGPTGSGSVSEGNPAFAAPFARTPSGGTAFGTDADVAWPMEYLDPITLEPMDDPVRTAVGKCRSSRLRRVVANWQCQRVADGARRASGRWRAQVACMTAQPSPPGLDGVLVVLFW